MRITLLLALLLLAACAARPPAQSLQSPAECHTLYVILPGNYIIDVAAGDRVTLNPAVEEFPLFCSQNQARAALAKANLHEDWRLYSLKGSFAELAQPAGNGAYKLSVPAEIADWQD